MSNSNADWLLPGRALFVLGIALFGGGCGARSELLDAAAGPPKAAAKPPRCDGSAAAVPWLWTSQGASSEYVSAVAFGPDSSVYVAGDFTGDVDFDPGPAEDRHEAVGGTDAFLTKLFCDGSYGWTRTLGGLDDPTKGSGWGDGPFGLTVTPDGAVLVSGQYCSTVDFDPGPGTDVRTSNGCFDGFVTKLNADGSYGFTRTFGGAGIDRVGDVSVGQDGAIVLTGQFETDVDFDPGPGVELHTSAGLTDRFVVKLDPDGKLLWARTWGGQESEFNRGDVAVAGDGAVFVAGQFRDLVDFDPGPGDDARMAAGADDGFVMKFSRDGAREWAVTWGGANAESVTAMALAPDGSILVAGDFYGDADFDPGPGTDVHATVGTSNAYVTRLEPDGAHRWTRTWGAAEGAGGDMNLISGSAVSPSADGGVMVAGLFHGKIDFDPGPDVDARSAASNDLTAFVCALDANGGYAWTRSLEGAGASTAMDVAVLDGAVLLGGFYKGTVNFDPGSGTLPSTAAGEADAFVVRFTP